MMRTDLLEYFPDQILPLDAVQTIFQQVFEAFTWPWPSPQAKQEWRQLAELTREALEETSIWGMAAKDKWVPRIQERLPALESEEKDSVRRAVRAAYIAFLDRLYGAIFRHVLSHLPTALYTEVGYLHLSQVVVYRYARLRDTEKSALEQLLELIYQGGPRFEMVFSWHPPGGEEEEAPLRHW